MSHFSVVVCLDDPNNLKDALAPFDENREIKPYREYEDGGPNEYWAVKHLREEGHLNPDDATLTWQQVADAYNARYGADEELLIDEAGRAYQMSTRNPDAKWDYWCVGGRWGGYFRYHEGCRDKVLKHERDWDSPDGIAATACDGGPKAALDLSALREAKAVEARKTHAKFHEIVKGTPEALPWRVFADNISPESGYTIERARQEYHSQPRVQAIRGTDFQYYSDAIETFQQPEHVYVEKERMRAVPGYAVLTLDGQWMAPGRMGWFGISDDDEGDRISYWEAANAYIDSLPDSVWLIAVDCHI